MYPRVVQKLIIDSATDATQSIIDAAVNLREVQVKVPTVVTIPHPITSITSVQLVPINMHISLHHPEALRRLIVRTLSWPLDCIPTRLSELWVSIPPKHSRDMASYVATIATCIGTLTGLRLYGKKITPQLDLTNISGGDEASCHTTVDAPAYSLIIGGNHPRTDITCRNLTTNSEASLGRVKPMRTISAKQLLRVKQLIIGHHQVQNVMEQNVKVDDLRILSSQFRATYPNTIRATIGTVVIKHGIANKKLMELFPNAQVV